MATNVYFNQKVRSEQTLYEDIVIESLKMYGQDMYYLPRDVINKDPILADDVPSRFNSAYKIEMYIDDVEGYSGEGDLFSKFGVELRDQVTLTVARRRWQQTVSRYDNEITGNRPREGDLIYVPLSNTMFEIMHVEHEQPFYQLSNLPTFKLRCEKFEYNDEALDTGVEFIDNIEQTGYQQILTLVDSDKQPFVIGNNITQTLSGGLVVSAQVVYFNDSDNVLKVAHVGSNSENFHLITTGVISHVGANGSSFTRIVSATDEQLNQPGAQNEEFNDVSFIDFSENNPFGDPEVI